MASADSGDAASVAAGVASRVVIDTDPGIDDAMALFLALSAPDRVRVEACTIVMGNNDDTELLARNCAAVLTMAGADEVVKVVRGASKPLAGEYDGASGIRVHGSNGLGGVTPPVAASKAHTEHEHADVEAARYLVDLCAASPGEITIIALGPLTNIAAACQLSAGFAASVKELVIMGGTVDGRGNKAPAAEANVHNDPEAARIVFETFPHLVMAGLNLTRQVRLTPEFRARVRDAAGACGRFMYDITQHYVDLLTAWGNKAIPVHDSSAVMYVLHPELFEGTLARVDVETEGRLTRGATVADWNNQWKRAAQTLILTKVDEAAFHDAYVAHVSVYADRGADWAASASGVAAGAGAGGAGSAASGGTGTA